MVSPVKSCLMVDLQKSQEQQRALFVSDTMQQVQKGTRP